MLRLIGLGLLTVMALRKAADKLLDNVFWSFEKIKKSDLRPFKEELDVRVNVLNQNEFDMPIRNFQGEIFHGNQYLAKFKSEDIFNLPAKTQKRFQLTIKLKSENVFEHLANIAEGGITEGLKPIRIKGHFFLGDKKVPFADEIHFIK